MIKPKPFDQEFERLKELESYDILDTLPEKDYDEMTAIAAEICGTSILLISLVDSDRQWFKSHHGLEATETPREVAFCAHAINDKNNMLIVQDSRRDKRFFDNPLVTGDPNVVFYAGVPLLSEGGMPLGTLCVIDDHPKILSKGQIDSLVSLGSQVMNILNLRRTKKTLEHSVIALKEKNKEIEQFAYIAAHDLKSPLIGISSMVELLTGFYNSKLDDKGKKMLSLMGKSAEKLRRLVDGLLEYGRSDHILKQKKIKANVKALSTEIKSLFAYEKDLNFVLRTELTEINVNRTALDQILINLMANAIKYSDKEKVEIELGIGEDDKFYFFHLKDNGPGIEERYREKIFKIFEVLAHEDKFGNVGNGLGLATVKKSIEKLGGTIRVESEIGRYTNFIFSIEK